MIPIGNQTSCWAATATEPFDYAVAEGFDAFEWFPDKKPGAGWDAADLDESRRRKIRDTARGRGLRLSVHARWQANPLEEEYHSLILQDLELAQDLGAVLFNIHLFRDAGLEAFVKAITPLVKRTAEAGLQLSIENTPYHSPDDFNELFARMGALDSLPAESVGMCLDLGHANLFAATRNDYLKFLDHLNPEVPIIHLHLHENWGDADSHLPLFTGPAGRDDSGIRGLIERLRRRDFSGSIILEQWPHPPSLLNQARDRLLQLLNRPPAQRNGGSTAEKPSAQVQTSSEICESAPATEGDGFVAALLAADQRCRSWREKLDFVRGLFAPEALPLTTEQLVDIAVYLRFLGTGEIPCLEDGRHFRPAHHARIARDLQARLASLTTPENALIIRRIYPWLPSSAQAFQRAEPLTRIRDIAHRSDIPSELKREIKHSLQNKLHRCAGPEDLATSAALLGRITAPGAGYSRDFVEQFRIFHEELKEFFNARSLDERLQALLPAAAAADAALIRSFLEEKTRTNAAEHLAALRHLTELREHFLEAAAQQPGSENQELLLADIGLEDFAFVLLSEMINAMEAVSGGASWEPMLDALLLTITNVALTQVEPEECRAIGAELQAWRRHLDPMDRDQLLRLKATTDRCRRLAEDYSDRVMALFSRRVEQLGRALGVPEHAIRVFNDAEIRGHIVFQLSKLVSSLLRRLRETLALPAWDVLVGGRAVGRLRAAESLEAFGRDSPEPVVALLKMAEGDEEIPHGVAGLVLAHEIPHLSHLGVRARQAGVVFVACAESASLEALRRLEGQMIMLSATPEVVTWDLATNPAPTRKQRRPVQIPAVCLAPKRSWLPLEEVVSECGGGKADGARRLAELSAQREADFRTPPGLVVPFGVMEAALRAAPKPESEYRRLCGQIDGMAAAEFAATTERLRALILELEVPDEISAAVEARFGRSERLMVRSSANAEDLEELAGAGLYESIANVSVSEVAPAVRAVWASLWTRRAALSRRQGGVPHERASMAVLIQQVLAPDFSFVLHTENPVTRNPREVYAELAVGLGETLVSAATRGNPYRLVCDKDSGAVTTLALASFSQALRPAAGGGLTRRVVDYSTISLSRDSAARKELGRRLAGIARRVENAFGKPQDIEGAVVGEDLFLVQTRPQQGLTDPEER